MDKVTEIYEQRTSDIIKANSSCASHIAIILASVGHSYKHGGKCACTEQISLSAVLRHICIVLRNLKKCPQLAKSLSISGV